ncbi:MAG TPA: cell division protein FtsZ [Baekduia sp.]|nr:cell division protein FtsZ [Baekduia sp.]
MREGPLAALFKKTTPDSPEGEEAIIAPATPAGDKKLADYVDPRDLDAPYDRPKKKPSKESGSEDLAKARLAKAFRAEAEPSTLNVDPFARNPSEVLSNAGAGHPVIRVVGIGGAGVNAVNRMVDAEIAGVEFVAINTDLQSLQQSDADITLHIGPEATRGLGAGSDPELGRQAAIEDLDRIKELLRGSDMVFVAAGAGGGTGTGAAPVVARIARELGALTVGIITKPFGFEGSRRAKLADDGIAQIGEQVDTLIVVPNNRLLTVLDRHTSMLDAFAVADDVLRQGVQGVTELVTLPGIINLDFADVKTIMSRSGPALLGIGMGNGEHRAIDAAAQAVASPLLDTNVDGARSILLSITGGENLSLWEVNQAAKAVKEAAHPDANIIFGANVDEKLEDQVWVTVVATNFGNASPGARALAEEPRGARRVADVVAQQPAKRSGLDVNELDVPEFLPRS